MRGHLISALSQLILSSAFSSCSPCPWSRDERCKAGLLKGFMWALSTREVFMLILHIHELYSTLFHYRKLTKRKYLNRDVPSKDFGH